MGFSYRWIKSSYRAIRITVIRTRFMVDSSVLPFDSLTSIIPYFTAKRKAKTKKAALRLSKKEVTLDSGLYPAIKGHFSSLLISNIFCNPLFLDLPLASFAQHAKHSFPLSLTRIPFVCFCLLVAKGESLLRSLQVRLVRLECGWFLTLLLISNFLKQSLSDPPSDHLLTHTASGRSAWNIQSLYPNRSIHSSELAVNAVRFTFSLECTFLSALIV